MTGTLAVFDFDGTITRKDSFLELIKFHKGRVSFYLGMLLLFPVLLAYKLKLIPNWKAKEIVLTYFFKNTSLVNFQSKCDEFANNFIPSMIRPNALKKINEHKGKGDRVIIVTASAENWLRCWCDKLKVELIGTQLEVKEGHITGRISGKNCYGPEKLRRLSGLLSLKDYKHIYVYGDSKGDKEILEKATQKHYKYF